MASTPRVGVAIAGRVSAYARLAPAEGSVVAGGKVLHRLRKDAPSYSTALGHLPRPNHSGRGTTRQPTPGGEGGGSGNQSFGGSGGGNSCAVSGKNSAGRGGQRASGVGQAGWRVRGRRSNIASCSRCTRVSGPCVRESAHGKVHQRSRWSPKIFSKERRLAVIDNEMGTSPCTQSGWVRTFLRPGSSLRTRRW